VSKSPEPANLSRPEPSGPRYTARVALSCERGHAPGQVLHAVQEVHSVIDDRLSGDLGAAMTDTAPRRPALTSSR